MSALSQNRPPDRAYRPGTIPLQPILESQQSASSHTPPKSPTLSERSSVVSIPPPTFLGSEHLPGPTVSVDRVAADTLLQSPYGGRRRQFSYNPNALVESAVLMATASAAGSAAAAASATAASPTTDAVSSATDATDTSHSLHVDGVRVSAAQKHASSSPILAHSENKNYHHQKRQHQNPEQPSRSIRPPLRYRDAQTTMSHLSLSGVNASIDPTQPGIDSANTHPRAMPPPIQTALHESTPRQVPSNQRTSTEQKASVPPTPTSPVSPSSSAQSQPPQTTASQPKRFALFTSRKQHRQQRQLQQLEQLKQPPLASSSPTQASIALSPNCDGRPVASTPMSLSATQTLSLIVESLVLLPPFVRNDADLLKSVSYLEDVKNSLWVRAAEIDRLAGLPSKNINFIPQNLDHAMSPLSPTASPLGPIPFGRPIMAPDDTGLNTSTGEPAAASEKTTLSHWVYEIQKSAWCLAEKVKKYHMVPGNILVAGSRRRKLVEFCITIYSAWHQLRVELSLAISRSNDTRTQNVTDKISRLAIATGTAPDWNDIQVDDAKALFMQGEKYFVGYGATRSYDIAFRRYESAANIGHADAANMIGVMFEFGLGRCKDITAATKWYRNAVEGGSADGYNNLARIFEQGKGCEVSFTTAAELYKRAAELGHLDAMTNYGHMLENGLGRKQDPRLAVEMYRSAAQRGYARAQNALGSSYHRGRGVKLDYAEAVAWYRQAVDFEYAPALNNLGICYEEGRGVYRDLAMAKICYMRAAEGRHPSGTCNLGYMYFLEGDFISAMQHFHVAMALGSVDAAYHLGTLYESGCDDPVGVILNPQTDLALVYYEYAADRGHTRAQLRVAIVLICKSSDVVVASIGRGIVIRQVTGASGAIQKQIQGHNNKTGDEQAIFVNPDNIKRAVRYLVLSASPPGPGPKVGAFTAAPHNARAGRDHHSQAPFHSKGNDNAVGGNANPHGDPEAQNMLGELIELGAAAGIEGDGDAAEAAKWYRRSFRQGHARATFNLAALYESGEGVPRNHDKAIRLYREAARRGSTQAIDLLRDLAGLASDSNTAAKNDFDD